MTEPPADLTELDPAAVRAWWAGLSAAARDAVAACPSRDDPSSFVVTGRFVPREHPLVGAEWRADYFDYLLKYPELLLDTEPVRRTFHFCTAHPAARAALAAGVVPAGFACPVADAACPLWAVLAAAPGCDLRLTGLTVRPPAPESA